MSRIEDLNPFKRVYSDHFDCAVSSQPAYFDRVESPNFDRVKR